MCFFRHSKERHLDVLFWKFNFSCNIFINEPVLIYCRLFPPKKRVIVESAVCIMFWLLIPLTCRGLFTSYYETACVLNYFYEYPIPSRSCLCGARSHVGKWDGCLSVCLSVWLLLRTRESCPILVYFPFKTDFRVCGLNLIYVLPVSSFI